MTTGNTAPRDVTLCLHAWQAGDDRAADTFMPELYAELRTMAASRLRRESSVLTIDPSDLVNEAMARLFSARQGVEPDPDPGADAPPKPSTQYANRAHFLAVSGLYMRSILVDRARSMIASGRPSEMVPFTVSLAAQLPGDSDAVDVLALDEALRHLKGIDLRASRVIELSVFSGMGREDIALAMGISVPTVDRDLRFARAYINRALSDR